MVTYEFMPGKTFSPLLTQHSHIYWQNIHTCIGRTFTHLLAEHSHLYWQKIHTCTGRTFTHLLAEHSHLYWLNIHTSTERHSHLYWQCDHRTLPGTETQQLTVMGEHCQLNLHPVCWWFNSVTSNSIIPLKKKQWENKPKQTGYSWIIMKRNNYCKCSIYAVLMNLEEQDPILHTIYPTH